MKNRERVILITLALSLFSFPCFSDELHVPFAIHKEQFIIDAKAEGFDLNDVDGFIENRGSEVVIYTYKTISKSQMEILKNTTWKNLRK